MTVTGTEKTYVYVTWNDGSGVPNTGYDYTTTEVAINKPQKLALLESGVNGAGSVTTPGGRQQAGAVGGDAGAQAQQGAASQIVSAGGAGALGALNGVSRQELIGGGAASAGRATTGWRAGGGQALQTLAAQDGTNGAVQTQLRVEDAAEAGAQVVRGEDGALVRTGARADRVTAQAVRSQTLEGSTGPGRLTASGVGAARVVPGTDANGRLRAVPVSLTLPGNSLFRTHLEPGTRYLVETDPRFANYRDWLSSDFLFQAMQLDPALAQKRLGDGFYEQRLVREQIGQLTGSTFLKGYASDEEMYRALMTNGASFAQAHELRPGVALTAEQMALLTTDLVWLVEQEVTLADGTVQRVLVPQVYLLPRDGDLTGTGALIAGDRVNLALSGALDNSGDVRASQSLSATAQGIVNTGSMRGASLALSAKEDLRNLGGELSATRDLSLNAGRDLVIASTTASGASATGQRTVLDRVASLTAGGVMVLQAGQDVVLDAAKLKQTGSDGGVLVDAGRDLKLGTVQTASSIRATIDANNHLYQGNTQEIGSAIEAKGPVLLKAGQDLVAKGASVSSEGAVQLKAGRDLELLAAQATESLDEASKHKVKGFLKSTTTTRETQLERTTALGTTISGQTVLAQAGQDLLIKGSNVVSDDGTTLVATRDVKIENALDTSKFYENKQQVTKGLMGGGIGFTVGTRDQRAGHQADSQTVVGATVGSVNGDVNVVAGREFAQTGSVIQTPKGDVDVLAQKISIQGAAQQGQDVQTTAFRQSGLTVAVSAPLLSALQSTKDMAENVGKVGDARMQALGVAATAIKAKEAAQALQADPKAAGGLSVSITVGSSQSKSRTETTTTTNQGSEVTAGGDIRLTAQGAGKDSSLSVQGSDLAAAQRLALKAEGDVSLTSSQDLVKQKSANSSSSAAVGVAISVGSGGASMGFTASASLARGKSDGEDVIQRNTHVQGKEVSIESGGDTTLKGAVVSGDKVKATVGGDLNIESLQDTSRFRSESMQAGGSVTVGAGFSGSVSYGQSKVKSDFASVTEQSGIRAGDGGFQVEVKGNTDLKGGSITSTQAAVDAGANSFKSAGLTMSDIENKADYKGSSFSVSAGFGKKDGSDKNEGGEKPKDGSYQLMTMKPGDPGQSAGMGYASDKASSTTKAGISGVAGNSTARTGDAESGIKQIFDKEKVQQDLTAQVAITQTFGKEAAKQIGAFADTKLTEALNLRADASAATDETRKDELNARADQLEKEWGATGTLRVAAHALLGGLTGNLEGAVGAAAGTLTAPKVKEALEKSGLDDGLVNGLTALASTTVGGLAGGSMAGASTAFNEVSNNYLSHQQVVAMMDRLRGAKNRGEREAILAEYMQTSRAQAAAIGNCRGSECDKIAKDIAEGRDDLTKFAAEIGKSVGWNYELQEITNQQAKDLPRLTTQVDFNNHAKVQIKAYMGRNISPEVLGAIEYAMACTSLSCVQQEHLYLKKLAKTASPQDQLAISQYIGTQMGVSQTFGGCLPNSGCDATSGIGNVAMGVAAGVNRPSREIPSGGSKGSGTGRAMEDIPENYYNAKTPNKPSGNPSSTGTCSFRGDMEVLTADGYKSIENVRTSDWVLSKDERTGVVAYRKVLAQYSNPYRETVYVGINDGNGRAQTLVSNRIHPFFVTVPNGAAVPMSSEGHDYAGPLARGAWVDAQNLKPGFVVHDPDGNTQVVQSVSIRPEPLRAFNLTVDGFHTYFIKAPEGTRPLWVHNSCYDALPGEASATGKTTPDGRKLYTFADENGKQITVYQGSDGRYYDPKVYPPDLPLPKGVKSSVSPDQSKIPDVDSFEKVVNGPGLSKEEKLAYKKQVLGDVAEANGWVIDRDLTRQNGRVVYRDPSDPNVLWAQDTGHGRFEKHDRFGGHLGEYDIDMSNTKAPQGHRLKVK